MYVYMHHQCIYANSHQYERQSFIVVLIILKNRASAINNENKHIFDPYTKRMQMQDLFMRATKKKSNNSR